MPQLFFFGLILSLALGCGKESGLRPDILLVTFDTLRADHCSSYGYVRATTPNFDILANEGARFSAAYAPTATTAPSHASLFTGRDPLAHQVRRNGIPLAEAARTLAEMLRERGYRTAGFPSSFVVNGKFGFGQGFELFDDDFGDPRKPPDREHEWNGEVIPGGVFRRGALETTDRAIAWLDQAGDDREPIFLWIHYIDPHEPYIVPTHALDLFSAETFPEASLEQIVARYDTLIRMADGQLGRLVDRVRARPNPDGLLSILTSDHGEAFLDHGWRSHGVQIFEESVRIPLVIHWPRRIRPAVIESPVSLHDVLPTLLGLLGVSEENPGWAGRNLSNALGSTGEDEVAGPVIVQRQTYERDGWVEPIPLSDLEGKTFGGAVEVVGEMFAIRDGRWKYIEALQESLSRQLYDLENDPGESRNLAEEEPELVRGFSRLLAEWRLLHTVRPSTKSTALTEADRMQLRALGYLDPMPAESGSPHHLK